MRDLIQSTIQERLIQILQMLQMNIVGRMKFSLKMGEDDSLGPTVNSIFCVLEDMGCDTCHMFDGEL